MLCKYKKKNYFKKIFFNQNIDFNIILIFHLRKINSSSPDLTSAVAKYNLYC